MKSGLTDDNLTELREGQQYLHFMYAEPGVGYNNTINCSAIYVLIMLFNEIVRYVI
jgi:hypothetical protein